MSILFSLASSIEPGLFSFYQTNSLELERLLSNKKEQPKKYQPVLVKEEGYVGTISNYYNEKEYYGNIENQKKSPLNPNPGRQDFAYLNHDNDVLVVKGNVKFIPNYKKPVLSDNKQQLTNYLQFLDEYKKEFNFEELVKRYLLNIISGKIFWRNQYAFRKVVNLTVKTTKEVISYRFDTSDLELDGFNIVNTDNVAIIEDLNNITKLISDSLVAKKLVGLEVCAFLEVGLSAPTYPSQAFLDEKPEGKGRCLSSQTIDGENKIAIFSSQKIGNAIRTIDTWYSDDENCEAIPVEVYGVVVNQRESFRPSGKNSFYDYFEPKKFDAFLKNYSKQKENDKHYLMAMFIKGGVFGV